MYELMIVDDDDLIRERLKATIPFEKLGLTLCCEASDGEEALEFFEQFKPQIVISDINIPLLSGLDFARRILEENKETGVIIITGYGSLGFAQEAIKTGISDFLLKPVDSKEIEASLLRIIFQLDERAASFKERQNVERLLQESLPLLQRRFLSSFLNDALEEDEDSTKNHLEYLGINFDGEYFCVAVLIPNYYEHLIEKREIIQLAIENICRKTITEAGLECIFFYDALSRSIIIAYSHETNTDTLLEKQLSTAKDKLRFYYRYDFAAGVGWRVESVSELPKSYKGADEALGYKNSFGENNIVNIKNVLYLTSSLKSKNVGAEQDKLIEYLKNCDDRGLKQALQQYFINVVEISGGSEAYAKQLCIELAVDIVRYTRDSGLDIERILDADLYAQIMLSPNLYRAQKQMTELCNMLIDQIREKHNSRNSRLIEQAKKYIEKNISDPELNLAMVSEGIGLSKSYFCSLFKKETGYNFTEYINRVRIEKAKVLLSSTTMRVHEISSSVGYLSPNYFFQVFKRLTNKRPRDFFNSKG